jgi:hypothetical protein
MNVTAWNMRASATSPGVGAGRSFPVPAARRKAGLLERCIAFGAIVATVLVVAAVAVAGYDAPPALALAGALGSVASAPAVPPAGAAP